jgi:hypothetical protein
MLRTPGGYAVRLGKNSLSSFGRIIQTDYPKSEQNFISQKIISQNQHEIGMFAKRDELGQD